MVPSNLNGHMTLPRLFDCYWSCKAFTTNKLCKKKVGKGGSHRNILRIFFALTQRKNALILVCQKQLKGFLDGLDSRFVQISHDRIVCDPLNFFNRLYRNFKKVQGLKGSD